MNKYQKKLAKHTKQYQYIMIKIHVPVSFGYARKRTKRQGLVEIEQWYDSIRKLFRADYTHANRIVKQEYVTHNGKEYFISTVDLGMNHGFFKKELYYETMIFDDEKAYDFQNRYETREEALKGHEMAKFYIMEGYDWNEL